MCGRALLLWLPLPSSGGHSRTRCRPTVGGVCVLSAPGRARRPGSSGLAKSRLHLSRQDWCRRRRQQKACRVADGDAVPDSAAAAAAAEPVSPGAAVPTVISCADGEETAAAWTECGSSERIFWKVPPTELQKSFLGDCGLGGNPWGKGGGDLSPRLSFLSPLLRPGNSLNHLGAPCVNVSDSSFPRIKLLAPLRCDLALTG